MRVEKYTADTITEAMVKVRSDLGPEAVILHTRKLRPGGLLGFLRSPRVEVIAAVDTDVKDFPAVTPAIHEGIQELQRELEALKMTIPLAADASAGSAPPSSRPVADGSIFYDAGGGKPPHRSRGFGGAKPHLRDRTAQTLLSSTSTLDDWYRRLLAGGVAEPLARQLIQAVEAELSSWALNDSSVVTEHVRSHLRRRLSAIDAIEPMADVPAVIFIVGPTGVGKTTTVAKLAVYFRRSYGARVLLLNADTFRVGAIAQLASFGELLQTPVEVAYTPAHLNALIPANGRYDVVLVDTPGLPRDSEQIARVREYVEVVPNATIYLALTAGAKYEDMQQTVNRLGTTSIDALLFTKVDETASLGPVYSLLCETGLPTSFLTTGQRVPDDLEAATPERVVELMATRVE